MPNKEVQKVQKRGRQGEGGGNKPGSNGGGGRKPSIEKIKSQARKQAWDAFKVELAKSAWNEMQTLVHDPDPRVRLDAIKTVWAYAYGKPKESVNHDVQASLSLTDLFNASRSI